MSLSPFNLRPLSQATTRVSLANLVVVAPAHSKARKVKCDAVHPACGSCQRTARFEGRDPSEVVCTYGAGRRCGARKSRAKGASPVTDDSTTSQPQAAALPALPETQENFCESSAEALPLCDLADHHLRYPL